MESYKRIVGIEAIKKAAAPIEVELDGWNPGEVWAVRLRKPGLFAMQMKGGIPNPIMATVEGMFSGKAPTGDKASDLAAKAFYHIAKAALVEPTMEELEQAGVELTDQQYAQIYAFVLGGVQSVARFRGAVWDGAVGHGEEMAGAPFGADGADRPRGDVDGGRGDHLSDDHAGEGAEAPTEI